MDQRFKMLFRSRHITLSELARRVKISPGYLSKILNDKTSNHNLGILVKISEQVSLPVNELLKIIQEKEYLPEEALLSPKPTPWPNSFEECVHKALDAFEQNDFEQLNQFSQSIRQFNSPLQDNFAYWYEGITLAFANNYNSALDKFLKAQHFKACALAERRLKAKILFGIASMYLGKGDYKKALLTFRKSLMAWAEGTHAGTVYLNMGTLNRRCRDYKLSELCYRSALLTPVNYIQILAYAGLGQLYMDQKKYYEAYEALAQGHCLAKKTPGNRGKGELFCNLGMYFNEFNLPEKAVRVLKRGLQYTTAPPSKRTRLYLLTELLDAYLALKQSEKAELILQKLHAENIDEGDILLISTSLLTRAKKHLLENHPSQALPLLNQCYQLLAPVYSTQDLISCCRLLSQCYFQLKEPFQSDFYIRESKRLQRISK